jgi:O-antigen/teichoic acid export membrane protein
MSNKTPPNLPLLKGGVRLLLSNTAKSTYITSAADISLAGLAAITTALVARQLNPEEFGTFISLWTFITLIAALLDLGLGAGIIKYIAETKSHVKQNQYIGSTILFLTLIGLIQFLIITIGSSLWQKLLFPNISTTLISITAIGSWSLILSRFVNDALRANQKFTHSAVSTTAFAFLRFILMLTLIITNYFNLLNSIIVMSLSPIIFLSTGLLSLKVPIKFIHWNQQILKQLLNFSSWLGINQVISTTSGRIDILLLNRLAGATDAGIYGTASLMARVFAIVTNSILAVFAPRIIQLKQSHHQKKFLLKITLLVFVIWIGMAGIAIIAKPLILIIFGAQYLPAIKPFYLLLTAMAGLVASVPILLPIIYILKQPKIISFLSGIQLLIILIGSLILIPKYGYLAPAYLWLVSQFIILIGGIYCLRHWIGDMSQG